METCRLKYKNQLINQYLYDYPSVEGFFAFEPYGQQGFKDRYAQVIKEYSTDRTELVRILLSYNQSIGCGQETEENIQKLAQGNALVVATGQQAGVFTGPMYTIYKTISVIQLARRKSEELGVPVIPVFWVASEDHDFLEINHLDIVNREGHLERLVLDEEPEGKVSIGHIPISEALFKMIDRLEESVNPAEWKGQLLDELRQMARTSENLADWFARVITRFFKNHGLVIINPLLPGIRKLLAPLYQNFIRAAEEVNEALQKRQRQMVEIGFEPQVQKSSENLHLFRYIDGERLPLLKRADNCYSVRGREFVWSVEELLASAREKPEQFSPNVVLRPIAQDYLMPLLAYVAGPGEIAYYALYKDIYPIFGMSMPIIYPRANVTLLEGNIAKLLNKYDLSLRDVIEGLDGKLREYLESMDDINMENVFISLRGRVEKAFEETKAEVSRIDSALVKTGDDAFNKVEYQINHYYDKVRQMHRKNNEVAVRQFEKIGVALFPKSNYQERVYNIYPYLFKHGPELLEKLIELPLLDGVEHKVILI